MDFILKHYDYDDIKLFSQIVIINIYKFLNVTIK